MHKQVSVGVFLALFVFAATGEERKLAVGEVPPGVIAAFQKAYPGAKDVEYEPEDEGAASLFEIEFKLDGKKMEVIYDGQGNLAYTEEEVKPSELPLVVKNALEKEYPNATLHEVEKLSEPDGSLRGYEVEIKEGGMKREIELDATGKVVKLEPPEKE